MGKADTDTPLRKIESTDEDGVKSKSRKKKVKGNRNKDVRDTEQAEEAIASVKSKKKNKKRAAAADPEVEAASDLADVGNGEAADSVLVNDDLNEPTMGEKLASLDLEDNDKSKSIEKQDDSTVAKPPSADSVNILLKQALHADDRALMLDCLYTQEERVIENSISQLNPSDVLKLLNSLIAIIESRGAVLACALPWLRSLLIQHSSGILSQESSLNALNSLYQLIESRISNFQSALQVSSCLDFLYAGIVDEGAEENDTVIPVVYLNDSESDEESDDGMETDESSGEEEVSDEDLDGVGDFEGSDDMSE